MKWPAFYLAALALHVAVLFGLKPPAPPALPAPEEKQYMEVTLVVAPPAAAPVQRPEPPTPQKIEPTPELTPLAPPPPPPPQQEALAPPIPEPPPPLPTPLPLVAEPAAAAKVFATPTPPEPYHTITEPSYASRIEPDYPAQARRQHQQGTVVIGLYLNAAGTLDKVEIVKGSGYPLLDQAAVDAMKHSRFYPAYQNLTPVPSHAEVSVTFQLQ